jgi:hypothetical protein
MITKGFQPEQTEDRDYGNPAGSGAVAMMMKDSEWRIRSGEVVAAPTPCRLLLEIPT